jgi:hypothetical protein
MGEHHRKLNTVLCPFLGRAKGLFCGFASLQLGASCSKLAPPLDWYYSKIGMT